MRIRNEQIDSFSDHAQRSYADRIVEFLRGQSEEAAEADPAELRPLVEEQIERARGYRLESERDIATYVYTAFLLGEEFDVDYPAVQEVLPSPQLTPEQKTTWLADWSQELLRRLAAEEEA